MTPLLQKCGEKTNKVKHYGCSSFIFTKTFSVLRNILPLYLKKVVHALFDVFQLNLNKVVNICFTLSGIYPSSFTNVRFWTKIEFLKVLFHVIRSQNYCQMQVEVSTCWKLRNGFMSALVGVREIKPVKNLRVFYIWSLKK